LDHAQAYITEHAEHYLDEQVEDQLDANLTPKEKKQATRVYDELKKLVKKEVFQQF